MCPSTVADDSPQVDAGGREKPSIACNEECLLRPGNTNCGGCGMSVGLTMFGRAMAEAGESCSLVIPACCGIVTAGGFPTTAYGVPVVASTFASAPAFATGVASVRDLNDEPGQVICWAGDGGTYDIGIATLSAAAERNENIIYVCYDNEIYGNTGGQRSSATPLGARTTTTPSGKLEGKKDIMEMMVAHAVPYAATLSIAHPEDFARKVATALSLEGMRFLLMHSPCPTGWKSEPEESVALVRLAVASGLFPLYEVWDGVRYHINAEPDWTSPGEYFRRQRRFSAGQVDPEAALHQFRRRFERLRRRVGDWPGSSG
jgi:pyruvate ferredoxin oxidoreductase beta subunit/2-oxoisovalerate ferredoxin oxidoreductase beta subunit